MIGPDGQETTMPYSQGPFDVAASSSGLWATGYTREEGGFIARFPVGSAEPNLTVPMSGYVPTVLATDTAVWAIGDRTEDEPLGTLFKLDHTDGSIDDELPLDDVVPSPGEGYPVLYDAAADDEAVWLLVAASHEGETGPSDLVRLDATTFETTTYDPGEAVYVILANGAAWLPGEHGPIRVDQETGVITHLDGPDGYAVPIGATTDAIWFQSGTSREVVLSRVDLVEGQPSGVGRELSVEREPGWGSMDAVYEGGTIWLMYEYGRIQKVTVG